jgi:hydrogenase-4 component E
MGSSVDLLLVMVLLLNFFMLGTSRVHAVIQCAAAQGLLLGVLLAVVHGDAGLRTLALAGVAIGLKAVLIPAMLRRAMRQAAIRREVEPLVSLVSSLVLGALGTGLAIVVGDQLPLAPEHAESLVVPASLATVLTGFLVLTTRRKAITQVVGYLTLENGVFIFGLTLIEAMPFLVEVGVLLDLLVAIFVMGIVIDHIHREFSSMDAEQLSTLRD